MASVELYLSAGGAKLYRVRYRTPEGKQTDKRGFRTKSAAKAWATRIEAAKLDGRFIGPSAGRLTIGELGPSWLDRQRGHLKSSGFRSYESAWRKHVEPTWRSRRIGDIRFTEVQAWVAELSAELSASTVATVYSILARVLDDAVRDRMLASNPARGVKLPKRPPRRKVPLTAEQLDHLAAEAGRYRSLVLFLGIGGLRWGEAAAVRVEDIDYINRKVYLHRNAVKSGSSFEVTSLKGKKNRTVVLPEFVIEELARAAEGKQRDALLWPSRQGGYLAPPSTKSWLAGAVMRCQTADPTFPRVTAHSLRHTAASLAISAHGNPKVLQRMLGHESAAMTMDVYADLFESDQKLVAQKVGRMWAEQVERSAVRESKHALPGEIA